MEETKKIKWYDNRGLVIVLLILFFPVGIYALWKNYRFTVITKSIVTAIFILGIAIGIIGDLKSKDTISEANKLWESGNNAVAVEKYKEVIEANITAIDSGERPLIFQRVIEFDVENGNYSTAKYFIEQAMEFDVPLAFRSAEANNLLTQVQEDQQKAVSNKKKKSYIRASLDEFKKEIPLLSQREMEIIKREKRIEYSWKNLSFLGQSNGITFFDDNKDGKLDSILTIVPIDNSDESKRIESLMLSYALVQVASGEKDFAGEFGSWLSNNRQNGSEGKRFGDVYVSFSVVEAIDGGVFAINIGSEDA